MLRSAPVLIDEAVEPLDGRLGIASAKWPVLDVMAATAVREASAGLRSASTRRARSIATSFSAPDIEGEATGIGRRRGAG